MRTLKIFAAIATLLVSATSTLAEPISVNALSNYLNSIKTASAEFQQLNSDGSRDAGVFHMQRPHRMRFEYTTQKALVLASAGSVAVFDGKGSPQQYPLSKTPLSLILAPNVNLAQQGAIVAHGEVDGNTIVTIRDATGKTPGSVEMLFGPGPVLKQWVTTDELGDRTTIILTDFRTGVQFKPSMFSITLEQERGGR